MLSLVVDACILIEMRTARMANIDGSMRNEDRVCGREGSMKNLEEEG